MPMTVLEGEYQVVGAAPDGDSVRFRPDDPGQWDLVGGRRIRRNATGGAQLRLEGVDALETHYAAGGAMRHQPLDLAHAGRDTLLAWLGFTEVRREGTSRETVTGAVPETAPGWVVTRTGDVYGRCIAFAGRGEPPAPSGSDVFVTGAMVAASANAELLRTGTAYPTYYRGLFHDLRSALTTATAEARPCSGVWPRDRTRSGLEVSTFEALERDAVVLPKLYRRLVAYLALSDGQVDDLDGFPAYLDTLDDRVLVLSLGHDTGLSTVVAVDGPCVRMTHPPEDLVFTEK